MCFRGVSKPEALTSLYVCTCRSYCARVRAIECGNHVDSRKLYAKRAEKVMSFAVELLLSHIHAVAHNCFPRIDQGESSGTEAERARECLAVLPGAPLLCNSKQYEL